MQILFLIFDLVFRLKGNEDRVRFIALSERCIASIGLLIKGGAIFVY